MLDPYFFFFCLGIFECFDLIWVFTVADVIVMNAMHQVSIILDFGATPEHEIWVQAILQRAIEDLFANPSFLAASVLDPKKWPNHVRSCSEINSLFCHSPFHLYLIYPNAGAGDES